MFLLDWGELEYRLDPFFNYHLKNSKFKSKFHEKPLYKISKPFSGGTPSKDVVEYWNGDIPWVSPKDFKSLYLDSSEDKISDLGLKNSSAKLVPANSVLIVVRSGILIHTLPVTINQIPVSINQDLKAFVVNDESIIPEFLGHYLFVFGKKLLPLITKHSTTVQSVNTEQFSRIKIPIPPIPIQNLIVEKINKALSFRNLCNKNAEELFSDIDTYLLDELGIKVPTEPDNTLENRIFNADFTETLGNRLDPFYYQKYFEAIDEAILNCKYKNSVSKLRNCLSFIESGSRPSGGVKNIEEGVLSFGGEHVNWLGQIEVNTPKYIPVKYHKSHRLTHTKMNDVLIVKDGATTGKIGIVINPDHVDQNINEHVFLLRFTNLNPFFATYLLNTSLFQKTIKRQITGATVTGLTKQALKSILIPVPDMETQNRLVEIISQKRQEAFRLMEEAEIEFEKAKQEVEKMILE